MRPRSLLLFVLPLVCSVCTVWCGSARGSACTSRCCHFAHNFSSRLKTLRENYAHIRGFYEANDDLDVSLLDQTVEESFKSPFACHAMNNILEFYLDTVLPAAAAAATEDRRDFQPHMESIQLIFDQLKKDVTKCRHYFSCRNQFDILKLNSTYAQLESKGPYEAMSDLDLLFNYIERYLSSARRRSPAAR
ncbi:interleukin-10 [Brachionichthys hirsutus]|uniref:interleukin-10 n=1 Tax=Brachionichthys hirsutus TaxID=412623 RepID=UPI003604DF87